MFYVMKSEGMDALLKNKWSGITDYYMSSFNMKWF